VVGKEGEQLLVDPPIRKRKSLSFSELEKHWSGRGFILWKDPLNLFTKISPKDKGSHILRLQGLLKEAGVSRVPLSGVYDSETSAAVKEFQAAREILQDGIVGAQTLMLLYLSIDRFQAPTITAGRK
jgi:hypothetical protein